MSTLEDHKDVVRAYLRAVGAGDAEVVRSLTAEDLAATVCGQGDAFGTQNRDEVLDFVARVPRIVPGGLHFEITSMVAEDDRVVSECVVRATFPGGVDYVNEYSHHFWFRGGRICQIREYLDTTVAEIVLLPAVMRGWKEGP